MNQTLHTRHGAIALAALCLMAVAGSSQAGEIYGNIGLPGVGLGYAHPIDRNLTVRGDFMTLGSREKTTTENGIQYNGKYELSRVAVLADWFPFQNGFRLTGGVSANNYKITLDATGAGGNLTIGDKTYTTTSSDGLNVEIKYPGVTPYLGMGWGHQLDSGWRFGFDVGAMLGKPTVTATPRGALANQPDIQANIDKELYELRDGVGKVWAIPQLTLSVGYSF